MRTIENCNKCPYKTRIRQSDGKSFIYKCSRINGIVTNHVLKETRHKDCPFVETLVMKHMITGVPHNFSIDHGDSIFKMTDLGVKPMSAQEVLNLLIEKLLGRSAAETKEDNAKAAEEILERYYHV